MESKRLAVAMPERMHRELAKFAALLPAKPLKSGRTREYSLEDALLLAAMIYIDDYLYRQRQNVPWAAFPLPLPFRGRGQGWVHKPCQPGKRISTGCSFLTNN
ncbi:hypothetical protein [Sporomusa acidovorans]|uniref:Transposase n=1 Tax=Sporomusa acidovorans (strain ATCC 49682 / DSM 3132 / Mol) TaxID=1123286 RepID=A0ABZ3J4V9_SPOA4|nr:hypothetical protein [Sporomusa acidovorans]OZC19506.1 hypothetical protein SPACI_28310 [Sporomusa acidovorans DSM 3132]SDF75387.1 hypothetical protein SAMN04488499_107716 [Sporomusa acidovorans]